MAKHLIANGIKVFVTDVVDRTQEAEKIGAEFVSLDCALQNKLIILAMPMENLEETLNNIKDKLKPDTVVIDVCSLKIFASELMKKILAKNIQIIGTHPLFGPQSAKDSIVGMKIALCNINAKKETFEKVIKFCDSLRLRTIITTPEEHDRQMAVSQALTHFIGQACKKINLERVELSTKTFDDLMSIVDIIKNDTPKLFNNMQQMNVFAKDARESFIKAAMEIDNKLKLDNRRN
jgi:prephenate dehydrogenase